MFGDDIRIIGRSKSKVRQDIDQLNRTNGKIMVYTTRPKKDDEIRCPGRVSSSTSTSGTCSITLVTNAVIRNV